MNTIILSAGQGSRMKPLTLQTPKPLLKVGKYSLIEWHIQKLSKYKFENIVINIAYLGYKIPLALGNGEKWNINIQYPDEQKEGGLESAGGILKALPLLGNDTFLVVNGDIFTDYIFDKHKVLEEGILAHLILVPNPKHNPQGDFQLKGDIVIDEKYYTFSGIGYYSPELFSSLSYGKSALAPLLRTAMKEGKITGELYTGEWLDIGTPERLEKLNSRYKVLK
jgi:MurNAc alpha-1-phosphate uridylyltransferase